MGEGGARRETFATPEMAEILLRQGLVDRALAVIARLSEESPGDPRVERLAELAGARSASGEIEQVEERPAGVDRVSLELVEGGIRVSWEITDAGIEAAGRRVRCSGRAAVRLLTVAPGERGVRRRVTDIPAAHRCGRVDLPAVPGAAVHVAAVGFLGRNGAFAPAAHSEPLEAAP